MASSDVPKTCKVVMAETIAKGLLSEVKDTLQKVQEVGAVRPCLAAFLANDDPAAIKYAEWSKKTCEEKYVWVLSDSYMLVHADNSVQWL